MEEREDDCFRQVDVFRAIIHGTANSVQVSWAISDIKLFHDRLHQTNGFLEYTSTYSTGVFTFFNINKYSIEIQK